MTALTQQQVDAIVSFVTYQAMHDIVTTGDFLNPYSKKHEPVHYAAYDKVRRDYFDNQLDLFTNYRGYSDESPI